MIDNSIREQKIRACLLSYPETIIGTKTFQATKVSNLAIGGFIYFEGANGHPAKFEESSFDNSGVTLEDFFDALVELVCEISENQHHMIIQRRIDSYGRSYIAKISSPLTREQYYKFNGRSWAK